jgi:hypothetical protein
MTMFRMVSASCAPGPGSRISPAISTPNRPRQLGISRSDSPCAASVRPATSTRPLEFGGGQLTHPVLRCTQRDLDQDVCHPRALLADRPQASSTRPFRSTTISPEPVRLPQDGFPQHPGTRQRAFQIYVPCAADVPPPIGPLKSGPSALLRWQPPSQAQPDRCEHRAPELLSTGEQETGNGDRPHLRRV